MFNKKNKHKTFYVYTDTYIYIYIEWVADLVDKASKLQFTVWTGKAIVAISINKDDRNLVIDKYISLNNNNFSKQQRLERNKLCFGCNYSGYALNKTQEFAFICSGIMPLNVQCASGNVIQQGPCDTIFICNLNNMTFYQCTIKCPFKGPMHAICMTNENEDELLVFGFVNYLYRNKEWENILKCPFYLITFIQKFIVTEYLHILGCDIQYHHGEHFKINIDRLITSIMYDEKTN